MFRFLVYKLKQVMDGIIIWLIIDPPVLFYFQWQILNIDKLLSVPRQIVPWISSEEELLRDWWNNFTQSDRQDRLTANIITSRNGIKHLATITITITNHSMSNVTIIEKVRKLDLEYRKEREKYHIRKFNTFNNGLNKQP